MLKPYDFAEDFIFAILRDGTVVYLNPKAEAFYRAPAVRFIGRPLDSFLKWQTDHPTLDELQKQTNPPNEFRFEGTHIIHGIHRSVRSRIISLLNLDGKTDGFLFFVRPASEKSQQTSLQLRESRQNLELALVGAEMGIWRYEVASDKIYIDERAEMLTGVDSQHVQTLADLIKRYVHPNDAEQQIGTWNVKRAREREPYEAEFRVRSSEGEWMWVLVSGKPVDVDDGSLWYAGTYRDITDRMRSRKKLQESESRYQALSSAAGEGICVLRNQRITDINEQMSRLLGFPADRLIHLKLSLFVYPEDHAVLAENLGAPKSEPFVMRMIHRTGHLLFVETTARDFRFQDEAVKLLTMRDVTATVNTERELRLSEERYRLLVENLKSGVVETDMEGRILYSNPEFRKIFRSGFRELRSYYTWDFIADPKTKEETKAYYEYLVNVQPPPIPVTRRYTIAGGYPVYLEMDWHYRRNENGELKSIISVYNDVTTRKSAEEKLRQRTDELEKAHQRLRSHVENSPLGLVEWDDEWRILHWSAMAERIFGWKESEVIGQIIFDLPFIHYDDRNELIAVVEPLLQGEIPRNIHRNRNYTRSGRVIWCEWYNSVLTDNQGHVLSVLSLAADITDQQKSEEALKTYQEQLKNMAAQLVTTESEKRMLVATELHDGVCQLLASAQMRLKVLQDKHESLKNSSDVADLQSVIDNAYESARTVTYDLSPPILYELGIGEAIRNHLETESHKSEIKFNVIEKGEKVSLARPILSLLYRTFRELIINTKKHANATTVTVRLERRKTSISLAVRDDGRGFDSRKLAQGSTSKTSGFGLFSIREQLSAVEGQVEIQTAPGKGTSIKITVPIQP